MADGNGTGQALGSVTSLELPAAVLLPEQRSLPAGDGSGHASPGRSSRWRLQGPAALLAPEPLPQSPPAVPFPRHQVTASPGRFPAIYRTSLPGFPASGASSGAHANSAGARSPVVRPVTDEGAAVSRPTDERSLLRLAVTRAQGGGTSASHTPSIPDSPFGLSGPQRRASVPGSVCSDDDMTPRAQSGIPDPVAAILEAQLDKYLADQARKFPYGSPAQRRSDLEREAPPSRQPGPAPQPAEEPGPQAEEAAQTHPGPLLPAIGAPSPFLAARKVTEQAPSPRLESTEPDEAHCLHGSSRAAGHESDTEVERRQREDPTVAMWRPHAALLTAARGRPHSPSLGSRSTRAMHRLSYNGHYAGALAPAPAALSESTGGGAAGSYRCATEVGGPRLSLGIIGGRGAGILFNGVDSSSFPRRRLLANHQSMDGTPDLLQKPLQQLDSLPYINPGHSDWKERRQELKKRVLAMPLVQHVEALRDPQLPFVARVPDWKIGLG